MLKSWRKPVVLARAALGRAGCGARLDPLEPRSMFAAITWTGGGDGQSWTNPANWSSNSVPTANDDVTIGRVNGRVPIVNVAPPRQEVRTLNLDASLIIQSGTFDVTGSTVVLGSNALFQIGGTTGPGALRFTGTNVPGGVVIRGTSTASGSSVGILALLKQESLVVNALTRTAGNTDPNALNITFSSGFNNLITGGSAFTVNGDPNRGFVLSNATTAVGSANTDAPSGNTVFEGAVSVTSTGSVTTNAAPILFNNLLNYDAQTQTLSGGNLFSRLSSAGVGTQSTIRANNIPPGGISTVANNTTILANNSLLASDGTPALSSNLTIASTGVLVLSTGQASFSSLTNNGSLSVGSSAPNGSTTTASLTVGTITNSGSITLGVTKQTDTPLTASFANLSGGTLTVNLGTFSPVPNVPFSPLKITNTGGGSSLTGQFSSVTVSPTQLLTSTYSPSTGISFTAPDPISVPSAPVLRPADDTGVSNSDNYTSSLTTTFTGTAPSNVPLRLLRDGTQIATGSTTNGTYSFTASLPEGAHQLTVATDTITSLATSITIDRTAPVITASDPAPISSASISGQTVTYTSSIVDALDTSPVVTYSKTSGSLFSLGLTPVNITATDKAGNTSTRTINVVLQASQAIGALDVDSNGSPWVRTSTFVGSTIVSIDAAPLLGSAGRTLLAALDGSNKVLVIETLDSDGVIVSGSIQQIAVPQALTGFKVSVDPTNNAIYLLGTTSSNSQNVPAIARYSAAGVLDTTLGTGGVLAIPGLQSTDVANTAATVPGRAGGILIGGLAVRNGLRSASVIKLTATGTQVTSFGTRGYYLYPASAGVQAITSLAVTTKGTIFAAGATSYVGNPNSQALLVKLTSAGRRDASLKTNTWSVPGFTQAGATKVLVQGDGKVVLQAAVANGTNTFNGTFGSALLRLTTKSVLDTTFSEDGVSVITASTQETPSSNFDGALATAVLPSSPSRRIDVFSARVVSSDTRLTHSRVLGDAIDLTLTKPTLPTARAVKPGTKLTATVTVVNNGSIAAPGGSAISVRAFLLGSNVAIGTSTPAGSFSLKSPIAPGGKAVVRITVTVPSGSAGPLYLSLDVNGTATATSNPLGEIDLSNNTVKLATPLTLRG